MKILVVYVVTFLLNQEDMFFIIARGIMGIETLEEIRCVILSCS